MPLVPVPAPESPESGEAPAAPGGIFPVVLRRTARLILAVALAALGLWVARDFLIPLGWAVLLGIALWPVYERFTMLPWPGRHSVLAPALFTGATSLLILVPLGFVVAEIGQGSEAAVQWLGQMQQNGLPLPGWAGRIPVVGGPLEHWWREHLADPQRAGSLLRNSGATALSDWTAAFGAAFLHRASIFFVTMLALFFVFRDGGWLGSRLLDHADRLFGEPGERLSLRLVTAARDSFNGTVVVAVGEGVLIGIGYALAGVPHALAFAAFTVAFAMLPFGAWFAFTTASLLLVAQGDHAVAAALVFGWGAVVMLAGDNFVQPNLVGGVARLPFLWAFIGIFGGMQSFGLLGLFLGPVIMAGLMTIWREWLNRRGRA